MECELPVEVVCVCFFKQKTAYEMRISDWSSDVCSSDLGAIGGQVIHSEQRSDGQIASVLDGVVTIAPADQTVSYTNFLPSATMSLELIPKIGSASWRERGWQYG